MAAFGAAPTGYVCKLPTLLLRITHTHSARVRYDRGSGAQCVSFQCFTCPPPVPRQLGALHVAVASASSSSPRVRVRPPEPALARVAVAETATAEASTSICSARIDAARGRTNARRRCSSWKRGCRGQSGGGHQARVRGRGRKWKRTRPERRWARDGTHFRSCAMDSSSCANSRVVEGMSRGMVDVQTRERSRVRSDTRAR